MITNTPLFLADGGEMGARMRAHDWSGSALGEPSHWPAALATVVNLVLTAKFPMFILWGEQFSYLYNDSYMALLGERHPGALGCNFAAVWPELWSDFRPLIERAYAGESTYFENLSLTLERHGFRETAWFTFSYSPLRDAAGAVAGMFCACTETTGQMRAKAALQHEQLRWRGLFDSMQEGFFIGEAVRDEHGRMRDFRLRELNPVFEKQSGLRQADAAGKLASEIMPELPPSLIATYAEVLDGGQPAEFEWHVTQPEERWFEARAYKKTEQLFAVLFLDVSARKAADAALRQSEQRFRTLAQAMPHQMWAADAAGQFTWFNQRVFEYAGLDFEAMAGDGWRAIAHPDDFPAAHAAWRQALADLTPYQVDFRLRRRDGAYRWFRASGLPLPGERGTDALWVGSNTDIQDQHDNNQALLHLNETLEARVRERSAQLEAAHEALRQSQKLEAIGKLTGGVAHDFNNALQIISGNLQLLQDHATDNPEAARRLQGALAGVARGAKLSSQLLAFSRKQPLDPAVISVARLMQGLDDMLRRTIGERVELETRVEDGLWNTLIDPNQLENALLNLAINARDAMHEEGKLTIEAHNVTLDQDCQSAELAAGQYVMLAVSDTGSGMSTHVMQQVFEPFFTTKPEGHGTGLGLSMVYGFIKQSGGHVKLYSEIGQGTTVKIYLPRSVSEEQPAALPAPQQAVGGSETILVVEDDDQVRDTVVELIGALGYKVLKAQDAQSALAIIDSGLQIDMLFTDVVMPGPLRSPELARRARLALPDIAVLFTSGYTENAIVHGGRLNQGVALLSKPYSRLDLARKLRHMLGKQGHAPAPAKPAPTALSILLVEDNADMRDMTVDILLSLGHAAAGVASGEDAIVKLEKSRYDVLITDIGLPGMNGHELAQQARAMGTRNVIYASGYAQISQLDADSAWLQKPFSMDQMEALLARAAKRV
ncbi:PAS domain S-box-containing protein [Oxalobacteraceae bacterium GrIS 1.11]